MNTIAQIVAGSVLFALTFLEGARVRPLTWLTKDDRAVVSFGAGMASAYVFVHVMPELHEARMSLVEGGLGELRYEGMFIYFLALVGFMAFYGLDHLRRKSADKEGGEASAVHLWGFGLYAFLMTYLLAHRPEEGSASTVAFVVAITVHFRAAGYTLREADEAAYDGRGRFILAGGVAAGCAVGLLAPLEGYVVALLLAFVSGAIIVNSLITELPAENEGRFGPFLAGGILYGLMLLPLG